MGLPPGQREATLAEPHVGVLSIPRGDSERAPLTVPIWYDYAPGGHVVMLTAADSLKARLLQGAPAVSLCVQRLQPTVRYVTVEGPVVAVEPATDDEFERMAARYLSGDALAGYLETAPERMGDMVRVAVEPQRWLASDMGPIT